MIISLYIDFSYLLIGIDWKNNTRNVKVTDTGVVIKIESRDKVRVIMNFSV